MKRPAGKTGPPPPPAKKDSRKVAAIQPVEQTRQPLVPRPQLFAILLIGFVIWLGLLLSLYFRTVYPMRYPSTDATATRPGASALPSAPR
jgi:hypothetical protein